MLKNPNILNTDKIKPAIFDVNGETDPNSENFNPDFKDVRNRFQVYDLIDIILENIEASLEIYPKLLGKMEPVLNAEKVKQREMAALVKTKNNFSKLRVLLGPMEIRDPKEPKT